MVLMVLTIIAFGVGVALVFGAYFGATKVPGMMLQRKLDARIQEISSPEEPPDADTADQSIRKASQTGMLPALDKMLGGTQKGSALSRWIEQTGVKTSVSTVILAALMFGGVFGFIFMMLMKNPLAFLIGGALGAAVPFFFLGYKRSKRIHKFEEDFPEALDLVARALKAGHAFVTGLRMVADEMDEPVGPEFRKTFDEQNFGLPMKDALENLTARVPSLDVRFFATAVLIQRETGGNLSEILENLAHVVRERFKILRQVRVHTAHGRFTGYVLLALPVVLCIALTFINPDHMNLLFRERMGQFMLMTAVVMQTIGYFWIRQVIKIEV
ncbi:MAG TPA: type II secretion system F family protein [Vicinamibacterales bacterium]|jgi:tight adherence protein B